MDHDQEKLLLARVAQLEKENTRLREFNELLQAQRKEYLDVICGPVNEADLPTEEEMIEIMKTCVPLEVVYRDLGIPYGGGTK
jgi:hypothetical protein